MDKELQMWRNITMQKYCLIVRGKLVARANSLEKAMQLRAYEPWNPACEIYEFTYSPLTNVPTSAILVS